MNKNNNHNNICSNTKTITNFISKSSSTSNSSNNSNHLANCPEYHVESSIQQQSVRPCIPINTKNSTTVNIIKHNYMNNNINTAINSNATDDVPITLVLIKTRLPEHKHLLH